MYKSFFKRFIDIVLSFTGILVLSPLLVFIAGIVYIRLGTPVIYTVVRPGKNEKLFTLYKFRTMDYKRDAHGDLLSDNLRLSKLGLFLRKSSMDELPELLNILKGDMSIVGPRPLAVQYLPYYSEKEKCRHSLRPGLTGLAQINGRNGLDWDSKLAFDVEYIDRVSFIFDLMIMYKTISKVISRENVGVIGIDIIENFDTYRIQQKKTKGE